MKKLKVSKKKVSKRNFEKEYAEIFKSVQTMPIPEWTKPGDSFSKLSIYTHYANNASSNTLA
jgi:hypothetical protein